MIASFQSDIPLKRTAAATCVTAPPRPLCQRDRLPVRIMPAFADAHARAPFTPNFAARQSPPPRAASLICCAAERPRSREMPAQRRIWRLRLFEVRGRYYKWPLYSSPLDFGQRPLLGWTGAMPGHRARAGRSGDFDFGQFTSSASTLSRSYFASQNICHVYFTAYSSNFSHYVISRRSPTLYAITIRGVLGFWDDIAADYLLRRWQQYARGCRRKYWLAPGERASLIIDCLKMTALCFSDDIADFASDKAVYRPRNINDESENACAIDSRWLLGRAYIFGATRTRKVRSLVWFLYGIG